MFVLKYKFEVQNTNTVCVCVCVCVCLGVERFLRPIKILFLHCVSR